MIQYNVDFEIAAAVLSMFVYIFHCMKYSGDTKVNQEFRGAVLTIFLCNILDVISAIFVMHSDVVPIWLNTAVSTIFFMSPITMTYCLVRYVMAYIYEDFSKSMLVRVAGIIYAVDLLGILANLIWPWLFYFDKKGQYVHAACFPLCYVFPLLMMLMMIGSIIVRHKYFSRGQFWAVLLINITSIAVAVLQYFVLSNVLILYAVGALCILNAFFFLETPDYQKMKRTMADLEYLQKNLKEEVKKQTLVATQRREKVEQMSFQMIQTLATTIDAKDRYTNGHSSRVSYYAVLLARELGWNEEAVAALRSKGLLHDIGKIGVADVILNKPNRLKRVEYEVIQSHTVVGYEILRDSSFLPGSEEVARSHHERYDGTGYPDGLKGEEIPSEARIVAIADAYDAMNSDRVYRKALSRDIIRRELINGRGRQFDPQYLDVFVRLLDAGRLDLQGDEMEVKTEDTSGKLMRRVMESMHEQVRNENVDFLSGVLRREEGEDRIITQMGRGKGCLMLLEVQNLREINERSGRLVGDKVITELGTILCDRRDDIISSRNGGSQFLCYIMDVDEAGVYDVCDRLFNAFGRLKETDERMEPAKLYAGLCLTVSEDDYFDCYAKADKALYHVIQTRIPGYFFYRFLEGGMGSSGIDLGMLVDGLKKSRGDGAIDVEYEDFTRFYEYIMNLWKRYHHSFVLSMITIDQIEKTERDYENLEKAVSCMELAIRRTIRTVDVCTRYSSSQLLIILLEVGEENVNLVIKRIFQDFYKMYNGPEVDVSYDIADLNLEEEYTDGIDGLDFQLAR